MAKQVTNARLLEVAVDAAKRAGKLLLTNYGNIQKISYKGKTNLVTEMDAKAQALVIKLIRKAFPDHDFLAEEGVKAAGNSPYKWIIDPLDGTTNYIHGYHMFCVSIGLEVKGILRVGVVYAPVLKELFTAVKGKGAYLNGKRIHVSKANQLIESVVATGFPYHVRETHTNIDHFIHFLSETRAIRRPGSAALDMSYVAAGRFDGFWEMSLNPWDTAAAALIVEEAGGKVTDFAGGPVDIYKPEVMASNGHIHPLMLAVLNVGFNERAR